MSSRTHTHVGHCQACGKVHAVGVKSGKLAKHGYTTRFGYFAGTCAGADKAPLEISREYADKVVIGLRKYADDQRALAADLSAGTEIVDRVETDEYERGADGKYKRDDQMRRIPLFVAWEDATPAHRARAVERAIRACAANAEGARAHATWLEKFIPTIHGKPLTSVVPTAAEVAADAPLAVGDTVRLFGKDGYDAVCVEIVSKRAEGCGPSLNGHVVPHMVYVSSYDGSRCFFPVCRIRKASIVKRAGK